MVKKFNFGVFIIIGYNWAMLPKEAYWSRDRVEAVPYQIDWIDSDFLRWTNRVYGSPKPLFDILSRTVTVGDSELKACSHPTGGRSFVYELPDPYLDPATGDPCFEVDIKGTLLTSAGYNLFKNRFIDPEIRSEFKINPDREEIFGPFDISTAQADRDNIQIAQIDGFVTPCPVAIIKPQKLVFNGQMVQVDELKQIFKLPEGREFVFYVRGWPITSTRTSDLFPNTDLQLPMFTNTNSDQMVQITHKIRQTMKFFELPRLLMRMKKVSSKEIYQASYSTIKQQLANMFLTGYYPSTGKESDSQRLNHLTLHNWTTIGGLVEWAPISYITDIQGSNRIQSLLAIGNSAHEALTVIGVGLLDDFHMIPSFYQFLVEVEKIILVSSGKINPELKKLISNHKDTPKRPFCMCGDHDLYIEKLQKNPEMFLIK
jgi:hypothetical protein